MSWSAERLQSALHGRLTTATAVRIHESLAPRTTLRVGGTADCYVEPSGEEDLAEVVKFCRREDVPLFILGRGSNLLVQDGGIRGVVVCLGHPGFSRVEHEGGALHCGAGAKLKAVAQAARDAGMGGLEFLEGIPGSLGGALRMNAGAMGSWVYEVVDSVRAMDREGMIVELPRAALDVVYRECTLFRDHLALGAVLSGPAVAREVIEERRREFNGRRWSSQPAASSAGCIFKNPAGIPAGRLIDELGLKGQRIGGAVVSDLHGNFIVNEGRATASDVLSLIALVRERAQAERGIQLETEVEIVGQPGGGQTR